MRNPIARAGAVFAALVLLSIAPAFADGPGDVGDNVAPAPVRAAPVAPAPQQGAAAEPAAAINGQSGQLSLMGGEFNLNVPQAYRFYPAEVALAYLQRNDAAAPPGTVVGLVAPAGAHIDRAGTWATVLSYDAIGYVPSETASGLSDPGLISQVEAARRDQNRRFEGFAIEPAFDPVAAALGWAERTGAPGAQTGGDFRHDERVLARNGVAGLTSIGAADQMPEITAALPAMISMITFPEGRRYADFQPSSDTVSNYTVPALVTGVPPVQTLVNNGVDTQQTSVGGLAGAFPWIAGGVIVLAAAGYLMMRRRRDPNMDPDEA